MREGIHAVTGAFGYSGKYIARRLLDQGHEVITLTNSPNRPNPFEGRVKAYPFDFDEPARLRKTLQGVSVLYNTYWIRFSRKGCTFADAVRNSVRLFEAAREAGVERIVHISITNPSKDSPLAYFRGKAEVEQALAASGISHAILRPAILFGGGDLLINNIAWAVRHTPIIATFGWGDYRLQPIHVDDLAALAVEQGAGRENGIIHAIGPETFNYRKLVHTVAKALGKRRLVLPMPAALGLLGAWVLGKCLGDVVATRDEIRGLMAGLLCVEAPPTGTTRLSAWIGAHAESLGRRYAREPVRRTNRDQEYGNL